MQPKFKVGELCGFNADEAKVQMPDKFVVLNLRHAVGRIEKFLGYGYEVYIRYKGDDYLLCFPECMLHAVEDTYLNRIKVSHQSEIVATGTGMYYKFGDGSMYGMDGKPYVVLSEETCKMMDRIKVREALSFGTIELSHFVPLGICLDPEHRGKIVFKKEDDKKAMSKDKCISLLERYRAERDKVEKGRRFELRLRNSVVNEAIERAIALLKSGE